MITGTSGHSPLTARSSSRPSRSGIRTSTSARSNALVGPEHLQRRGRRLRLDHVGVREPFLHDVIQATPHERVVVHDQDPHRPSPALRNGEHGHHGGAVSGGRLHVQAAAECFGTSLHDPNAEVRVGRRAWRPCRAPGPAPRCGASRRLPTLLRVRRELPSAWRRWRAPRWRSRRRPPPWRHRAPRCLPPPSRSPAVASGPRSRGSVRRAWARRCSTSSDVISKSSSRM